MNGGWNEYDQNISDHRPVAMKIDFNYSSSFDINNDGYVNEDDIIDLLLLIFGQEENHPLGDLNFDYNINIFDLVLLCEHLYN